MYKHRIRKTLSEAQLLNVCGHNHSNNFVCIMEPNHSGKCGDKSQKVSTEMAQVCHINYIERNILNTYQQYNRPKTIQRSQ